MLFPSSTLLQACLESLREIPLQLKIHGAMVDSSDEVVGLVQVPNPVILRVNARPPLTTAVAEAAAASNLQFFRVEGASVDSDFLEEFERNNLQVLSLELDRWPRA